MRRIAAGKLGKAGLLVALSCLLTTSSHGLPPESADPVPIRRVVIKPEQLAVEMEKARQGLMAQLPRKAFEEKVLRAAQGADSLKNPPRLVEAVYHAELQGTALAGTASWTILNPAPAPGILAVQPFNLAVRQARLDNQDALLGDLDGNNLGLLVGSPGEHRAAFHWTARGEKRPSGLHFDLEIPPTPIAALELSLPADYDVAVVSDGSVLSEPGPIDGQGRCAWTIGFARRSQLHLTLRQRDEPGQARSLLLARLQTAQGLTPDVVDADFEFNLTVVHGSVRDLVCQFDPGLEPYEVTVPGLESWDVGRPSAAGLRGPRVPPRTLVIRLREDFRGGVLRVRCQAPLFTRGAIRPAGFALGALAAAPEPERWNCPGLRLVGAASRGETLLVRVHPEVRLEEWQAGNFRLEKSTTDDDGWQVLTLRGGGLDTAGPSNRPQARARTRGVDYRARRLAWWQLNGEQSSFTAQITYEVSRGRLLQLPLLVPQGWEVDRVETNPAGMLGSWRTQQVDGHTALLVDLAHALTAPAGAPRSGEATVGPQPLEARPALAMLRLAVVLRPAQAILLPTNGVQGPEITVPIPDLIPLGARWREGGLAIDLDEKVYQAQVVTEAVPQSAPDEEGPWGKHLPDFYYIYRGEAPQGRLILRPRPTRLWAACASEVFLTAGRVAVQVRLVLRGEVGNSDVVDIALSAPVAGSWQAKGWKVDDPRNEVRKFERLRVRAPAAAGVLAGWPPLGTVTLTAAVGELLQDGQPHWQHYRLTLARPLSTQRPLTLRGEFQAVLHNGRCEVPLVSVAGAARMDGEVKLYLGGGDLVQVHTDGLQEETPTASRTAGALPWRSFHYGLATATLTLQGVPQAADRSGEAGAEQVSLTTYAEPSGRLLHHYRFRFWSRRPQPGPLPLQLPPGARLLSVRVDGRWVGHLSPPRQPDGLLKLPVPAGAAVSQFEVVYTTDGNAGHLWSKFDAPAPALQVGSVGFHRTWCLPPGMAPLATSRYRRLPGPEGDRGLRLTLPDRFALLSTLIGSGYLEEWQTEQERIIDEAGRALTARPADGKPWTLGEALDQLVFDQLKGQMQLVLDITALSEAGLGQDSVLPPASLRPPSGAPWWQALGLVYVPCRGAPLLTTRRQWEAWKTADPAQPISPSLSEAVATGAVYGQDGSGRFRTAMTWLRRDASTESLPAAWRNYDDGGLLPATFGTNWVEWEAEAGTVPEESLVIVRQDGLFLVGTSLAGLLGLAFWGLGRVAVTRSRLAFLSVWLALSALAYFWLPAALRDAAVLPLVAALVVAATWYLYLLAGAAGRRQNNGSTSPGSRTERPSRVGPAVASLLALLGASAPGWLPSARSWEDKPAGAATVFLVPGTGADAGKENVLAPPDLLEELDHLARRHFGESSGCVIVHAAYQGQVVGDSAHIDAVLRLHCASDGPTTLLVPLAGVQLDGQVQLDGLGAFPLAVTRPRPGFTLLVKGQGPHELRMHFRCPIQETGEDRGLQFTLPPLVQSDFMLDLPAGARFVQALLGQNPVWGAQEVKGDTEGVHLEAQLGRLTSPLHVRWLRASEPARAVRATVQEAYLWELDVESSRLTGQLHYTVHEGSLTTLLFDLPDDLEVESLKAEQLPDGSPVSVQDWRLHRGPGRRRLQIDLPRPVTGELQLTVQMVHPKAWGATASLTVPTPRGVDAAGRTGHLLAYRLSGLETKGTETRLLSGMDRREFTELWRAGERPEGWRPTQAYRFQRRNGGPFLRLRLALRHSDVRAEQEIGWRLGQQQADLHATVRLAGGREEPILAEWKLSHALQIGRVVGREVRSWSRSGSCLQVWLEHASAGVTIELSGWMALPAGASQFILPEFQLLSAPAQSNVVRLSAAQGFGLEPLRLWQLQLRSAAQTAQDEWVYETTQPEYAGHFQIRQAATRLEVRSLTLLEATEQKLTFRATVECAARQGELRTLSVRLRNWDGDDVRLDAPRVQARQERRGDADSRLWLLELQPETVGRYRFTVTGSMALDKATGGVPMPEVSLDEADPARLQRWLATAGQDIAPEEAVGLESSSIHDLAAAWPEEAERLRPSVGAVWRVRDHDWNLSLLPRLSQRPATPVQLFLTEQTAAVVDGRHWAHQATYWLYHEASTDLGFRLPAGARVLSVAVDGKEVVPLQAGTERLWLPLPAGAGALWVRLSWMYDEGQEPLDQPRLEPPRLEGATGAPMVGTVEIPASHTVRGGRDRLANGARPASPIDLELRRAQAQLQLSSFVAPHVQARTDSFAMQFAGAQLRFYQACRSAERWLAFPELGDEEEALDDPGPAGLLQSLRQADKSLARTPLLERLRSEAEGQAKAGGSLLADGAAGSHHFTLPHQGLPESWQVDSDDAVPQMRLTPVESEKNRRALVASFLLMLALGAVWWLSYLPGAAAWLRSLWPEQLALAACLGCWQFGPGIGAALLLLVALAARLFLLGRQALTAFQRGRQPASS